MTRRTTRPSENITLPLVDGRYYDFEVHRGDGTVKTYQGDSLRTIGHRYITSGDYQIKIYGTFPSIYLYASDTANRNKLRSIDQWGNIERETLDNAFYGATYLQILATDVPNLSNVGNTSYMFYGAKHLDADFSARDISTVSNMRDMLYNTALSTYHYNALLWSRSNQHVHQDVYFNAVPAQYGGCAANRQQGISGYDTLRRDNGWKITDEGLALCTAKGDIAYSTTLPTQQKVIATLTLNDTGEVISPGRSGSGNIFTKAYTENVSGEVVAFSVANATGTAIVHITWIEKAPRQNRENNEQLENSGKGGSALNKDICPAGDFSPSYYDKDCGTTPFPKGESSYPVA
jgi:hypothetical protein